MDLNGCQQRLFFAHQLTQQKCSLCSQGTFNSIKYKKWIIKFILFIETLFSLDRIVKFYTSDYNSDSDSIASENQL